MKLSNIIKTISSMKLNRSYELYQLKLKSFKKDLESSIGRRLLHDAIIMEGFLDIINGDTVIHGKNSVVDQGLIGIINFISAYSTSTNHLGAYSWYMVIGSDTSHGTTNGTTTLSSPIGTSPGTTPNTQSGVNTNPGTGQWQVQWVATWNPGTVSGTLGEVGLYLHLITGLQGFSSSSGTGTVMFSRMASADNKFTSFTINTTVPLSIAWNFRLTYAI